MNTPEETALFARSYAAAAHGGQTYGTEPYTSHLDLVVLLLRAIGRRDLSAAGYLHDVLEDTSATPEVLAAQFPEALPIVEACTGRGVNRRARQADIARKLAGFPDAQTVKVCDRVANTLHARAGNPTLARMYAAEFEAFRSSVPAADPRALALLNALR